MSLDGNSRFHHPYEDFRVKSLRSVSDRNVRRERLLRRNPDDTFEKGRVDTIVLSLGPTGRDFL